MNIYMQPSRGNIHLYFTIHNPEISGIQLVSLLLHLIYFLFKMMLIAQLWNLLLPVNF